MLESLFSILAPHNCQICNTPGSLLCELCQEDEITPLPSTCYRCNKLTDSFKTCRRCRSSSDVFALIKPSAYQGPVKQLIKQTKFSASRAGADDLGTLVANRLTLEAIRFDLVTYLPTANKRVRQRGFDHAKRMAAVVAQSHKTPFIDTLQRSSDNRQLGATRLRRKEQVAGVFRVRDPTKVANKTILAVDDVVSTGASVEEVAKTLKQAGAKRIVVAVAAHNL